MRLIVQLVLYLLFLTLLAPVQAQYSLTLNRTQHPGCAARCIGSAFRGGLCAPKNQTCVCRDEEFRQNVTLCVTASCTVPEGLLTKNASMASCGAPIRDRSRGFAALSITLVSIAATFVAARFGSKIFTTSLGLGMDDWLVLATIISAVPTTVITVHGTAASGLGRDIWTLEPEMITKILRYVYHMSWLYYLQSTLVKLSMISFYIRIFPLWEVRRVLWVTFIFTSALGIGYIFTDIFQCWPITFYWEQWDGLHTGTCADENAIIWSFASISIALDIWILALPLWQLRNLRLHWKRKAGVALMFSIGILVTIVTILRLHALVNLSTSSNQTWDYLEVSLWSNIEICAGIMCACMPAIRMILVRVFPNLAATSQRSRGNQYYQHESGDRSRTTEIRGHRGETLTTGLSNSEEEIIRPGIIFQQVFTVQYSSDRDEASLVHLTDMDEEGRKR